MPCEARIGGKLGHLRFASTDHVIEGVAQFANSARVESGDAARPHHEYIHNGVVLHRDGNSTRSLG